MQKIRVGFIVSSSGEGWLGGLNYIRNLLQAVTTAPQPRVEPVLFVASDVPEKALEGFPALEAIRTGAVARRHPVRLAGMAAERLLGRNLVSEALMRRHAVSVLSHVAPLGGRSRTPTISWIPDFQHRYLPDLFSPEDLVARDRGHARIAAEATTVLLSSHDAQKDFLEMAPRARGKSRVLHFVAGLGDGRQTTDKKTVHAKYRIDRPYFYVPNQFWRHKNHQVIVDALAILRRAGRPALVLASGHTGDYRHPDFFATLMRRVDEEGVADDFRVLGVIPYADVGGLMANAIAIINPSLFEGWSTTVEECKSAGKQIILSDIAVHREQAPRDGVYFPVDDAAALAEAMRGAYDDYSPAVDEQRQAMAREQLPERFAAFAREYEDIVIDTLARR